MQTIMPAEEARFLVKQKLQPSHSMKKFLELLPKAIDDSKLVFQADVGETFHYIEIEYIRSQGYDVWFDSVNREYHISY